MKVLLRNDELQAVQKIELEALREFDRICRKNNINYSLGYGTLIGAVRHKGFIPWDDDIDVCLKRSDFDRFKELCKTELSPKYFYQCHETDEEYCFLYDKIRVNGTLFKENFTSEHNIHNGVYIDIFPIDNFKIDPIKGKLHFLLFHIFRNGLMAKYGNLSYRKGKKKISAIILRFLYYPFSTSFLYVCSNKIARWWNNTNTEYKHNFCGPYKLKDVFRDEDMNEYIDIEFEDLKAMAYRNYDVILKKIYGNYMIEPPKEKQITRHELIDFLIGEQ